MKKLSAICAGIVLAAASVPCVSAGAAETAAQEISYVAGDIDLNKRFSMSDLVLMKKYLMGGAEISEEAYRNADVNGDGSVDVFDYCKFRQMITQYTGSITKKTDMLASSYLNEFIGRTEVITSVYELENYFYGLYVMTVDEECYYFPFVTEEEYDNYLSIYDDEFFEHNVLCLNTLPLGSGNGYKIDDVYYEGDTLKIEYHQPYGGPDCIHEPIMILAQVTVPREIFTAKNVEWEQTEAPVDVSVETDITTAADNNAWKYALSGGEPMLFNTHDELEEWLTKMGFRSAVKSSLLDTYDEGFFYDNDLVLDLYAQTYGGVWNTVPRADVDDMGLKITYDRTAAEGRSKEELLITQVTVPKGSFTNDWIRSERSWESRVNITHSEYCLASPNYSSFAKVYGKTGEWVGSQEELDAYLSDCLTDEGLEFFGNGIRLGDRTAYVWVDSDISGSTHELLSAYNGENGISLYFGNYRPLGCEGEAYLHIIYTDKELSGSTVSEQGLDLSDYSQRFSGSVNYFSLNDSFYRTLVTDSYSFGNSTCADIYIAYPGGGDVQFRSYGYIGTLELASGYDPFSGDYLTDPVGDGFVASSNDFSIYCKDNVLTIRYRTNYDSDFTEATFDINS